MTTIQGPPGRATANGRAARCLAAGSGPRRGGNGRLKGHWKIGKWENDDV